MNYPITKPTNAASIRCRVCDCAATSSLPIAAYAPFFRLRVDVGNDRFALYTEGTGLSVHRDRNNLAAKVARRLARVINRFWGTGDREFLRTCVNFCSHCQSLTLSHDYGYQDLEPLYTDYRSEKYNAERISVEPSYRAIATLVGQDEVERTNRNREVARFLQPFLPDRGEGLALDLGGSDGKFIPLEVSSHFFATHIVDTSDAVVSEPLRAQGVRKVPRPDAAGYSLVMCMHVLEHVGNPRQFVIDALAHMKPGGLLYLEVPLELDPRTPAQFQSRIVDQIVPIHEHINQFSATSLPHLIDSIGALSLLRAEHAAIDCGWTTGTVGRCLAQRVD